MQWLWRTVRLWRRIGWSWALVLIASSYCNFLNITTALHAIPCPLLFTMHLLYDEAKTFGPGTYYEACVACKRARSVDYFRPWWVIRYYQAEGRRVSGRAYLRIMHILDCYINSSKSRRLSAINCRSLVTIVWLYLLTGLYFCEW